MQMLSVDNAETIIFMTINFYDNKKFTNNLGHSFIH